MYNLEAPYPNPFNPTTTISYSLPMQTKVSLTIYSLQGKEVKSLVNGIMDEGYHSLVWNSDGYSSGVYFIKMIAGEYIQTQKLIILK